MKYAVRDSEGVLMSVFNADNLAEAVEAKHAIQNHFNGMHRTDEIFSVGKATRKEIRDFEPGDVVVGIGRKGGT